MARHEGTTEPTKREEERGSGGQKQGLQREGASLAGRPLRGEVIRSPFSFFERMFGDMDRIFEEFGLGTGLGPLGRVASLGPLGEWAPQVEVLEREGNLIVRADLPGVKQEDVHVRIDQGSLVLSGERRSDRTEEGEGFWRSERSYGSFQRLIPLPPNVDPNACEAKFENGVLEVQLKLPESARSGREIPIGGASAGTKKEEKESGKKRELS